MTRYSKKSALDASNAPVRRARMKPELRGKALDSWKDEM
jgi:hypothetical protein